MSYNFKITCLACGEEVRLKNIDKEGSLELDNNTIDIQGNEMGFYIDCSCGNYVEGVNEYDGE